MIARHGAFTGWRWNIVRLLRVLSHHGFALNSFEGVKYELDTASGVRKVLKGASGVVRACARCSSARLLLSH